MRMPLAAHRFTVDEYQRMGQAGVFHEDDRVELIDGQVVEMRPHRPAARGVRGPSEPATVGAGW